MAANVRNDGKLLKRSSSELDLFTPSRWGVMVPMKDYPDVLCRIESFQRPLSTTNLCRRRGFVDDGFKDRLRIVENPKADESPSFTVDDAMFDKRALGSFVSQIRSKRTFVLLRGPSGSGKSTFAAVVARRVGNSSVVLSTDEFYVAIDGSYRFHGALIATAHEWNRCRARFWAKVGRSPIFIDNTNLAPFEMAPYVQLADEFGYKIVIKEPPTSWKRNAEVCALMSRHKVPEKKTRQMVRKFQPIDVGKLRELMKNVQISNGPARPAFSMQNGRVDAQPSSVRRYASSTYVTTTVSQKPTPQWATRPQERYVRPQQRHVRPQSTTVQQQNMGSWAYPPGLQPQQQQQQQQPPPLRPPPGFFPPSVAYQQHFGYAERAWGYSQPAANSNKAVSPVIPAPTPEIDVTQKVDEAIGMFSRVQFEERSSWTTYAAPAGQPMSCWGESACGETQASRRGTWAETNFDYRQTAVAPAPAAAVGGSEAGKEAGYAQKRSARSRLRHAE